MRFEFSAGGVVFQKKNDNLFILLCQHSQNHGWGFPKGLIGDLHNGEGKEQTAIREVKEETGADGKILKALTPVEYWYQREGEKAKKTVYYYVMECTGGDITNHDFEMESVEWVEERNVLEKLTYPADKKVFKEALPVIEGIAGEIA